MQFLGLNAAGEFGAAVGAAFVSVTLALFYLSISLAIDSLPRA
jgi:hypothetical protein